MRHYAVADPGFPVGGRLPMRLRFATFVCQCERICTFKGRVLAVPPGSTNAMPCKNLFKAL